MTAKLTFKIFRYISLLIVLLSFDFFSLSVYASTTNNNDDLRIDFSLGDFSEAQQLAIYAFMLNSWAKRRT